MKKHAGSPAGGGEYTACGLAFDGFLTGDHDEPIVFAKSGELVTCEECREFIDYYRQFKSGYRQP